MNEWPGGFQGDVRVTNGQRITQIWSGRTSQTASPYTVTNETWNGAHGAGQSVNFGFLGSWTSTNGAPTVTCSRTP